MRTYGAHMPLTSTVVYGGVGMQPQVQALRRGVDILVATPGRLLDHVQQKTVDLSRRSRSWCWTKPTACSTWASSATSAAFWPCCRASGRTCCSRPRSRTRSASLADAFLHDPVVVEVAPPQRAVRTGHARRASGRPGAQARAAGAPDQPRTTGKQVLVFTRTKHGANRLAEQLVREGISADAIHGNKSQSHRTRTLADFKRGELRVLVATDIAARGLDIEELPHVVNFDLPHVPEDYVHRIGRTGRAGVEGDAVSLVCAEDQAADDGDRAGIATVRWKARSAGVRAVRGTAGVAAACTRRATPDRRCNSRSARHAAAARSRVRVEVSAASLRHSTPSRASRPRSMVNRHASRPHRHPRGLRKSRRHGRPGPRRSRPASSARWPRCSPAHDGSLADHIRTQTGDCYEYLCGESRCGRHRGRTGRGIQGIRAGEVGAGRCASCSAVRPRASASSRCRASSTRWMRSPGSTARTSRPAAARERSAPQESGAALTAASGAAASSRRERCRKARIGLARSRFANLAADQREHRRIRQRRSAARASAVSNSNPVLSRISSTRMARDARSRAESAARPVEREQAQPGQQRVGAAGPITCRRADPRCADEIHLRHHHPARMLLAEQDHARHQKVQIGRAERAGPAHLGALPRCRRRPG